MDYCKISNTTFNVKNFNPHYFNNYFDKYK